MAETSGTDVTVPVPFIDAENSRRWYKAGLLHRVDGPAVERIDGTKEWFKNGLRHRLDGPAIEYPHRSDWWRDGLRHRLDGPAVVCDYGTKEWFQDDRLHRDDGPAVEYADDASEWYQNGERHRLDGPAVERANGYKEWFQNDRRHRDDGPAVEQADGRREWWQNGQPHRVNGPAIVSADGVDLWCLFGVPEPRRGPLRRSLEVALALAPLRLPAYVTLWILQWSETSIAAFDESFLVGGLQRLNASYCRVVCLRPADSSDPLSNTIASVMLAPFRGSPALRSGGLDDSLAHANDIKEWRRDGRLHRLNGPAVERANGDQLWYQNGQYHRLDGPAVVYVSGTEEWWRNGQRHRLDGPAIIDADGGKFWFKDGLLHRLEGPAVKTANGDSRWYLFGTTEPRKGPVHRSLEVALALSPLRLPACVILRILLWSEATIATLDEARLVSGFQRLAESYLRVRHNRSTGSPSPPPDTK